MSLPLILSLTAAFLSVICLVLVMLLFKRFSASATLSAAQKSDIKDLDSKTNNLSNEIHEIRSGNYGVIKRIKELVQEVEQLKSSQQSLVDQDPQVRFYSKAAKLIGQGASLEEVIKECDIPSAEAELLFSLHKTSK